VLRRGEELVQQDGLNAMHQAARYAADAAVRVGYQAPRSSYRKPAPLSEWPSWSEVKESDWSTPYRNPNPPETYSAGLGVFILIVTALFCGTPWSVYLGTNTGDALGHLFWVCWSLIAIPACLRGGGRGIYTIYKAANQ
jgi:hypothetical protein